MNIKSRIKDYEVIIENDLSFLTALSHKDNTLYVVDKNIYELYGEFLSDIPKSLVFILEATEQNKVIDTALDICERLTEIPAKRNATLVSIGGGIIQDITGFVANITYRGIHWIFVPTTLLSACDSCIGGKTSLNYKRYKNLLGTFFPPEEIHIASEFFMTLTERDFKSGLGEVIKFNIMAGRLGLNNIENNISALLERNADILNKFVDSSLAYKKGFIELDEFDCSERIKLNFAHTFGHAIEVIAEYEIPHGTAVAIGMIMANSISARRGLLDIDVVERSENVLLDVIDIDLHLLEQGIEGFIDAMRKDKKQTSKALTAVLIANYEDEPELCIVRDISVDEVQYAVDYFIEIYRTKK